MGGISGARWKEEKGNAHAAIEEVDNVGER